MFYGGTASDVIFGRAGDDVLKGPRGNDAANGGPGFDHLHCRNQGALPLARVRQSGAPEPEHERGYGGSRQVPVEAGGDGASPSKTSGLVRGRPPAGRRSRNFAITASNAVQSTMLPPVRCKRHRQASSFDD
ncbi:hypothetical protein [Nonomuraea zeae]|uniref:hypothetical protein n=1 Tax=Nonomuraea zeae TaxID=1642303 RepID=UPI003B845297